MNTNNATAGRTLAILGVLLQIGLIFGIVRIAAILPNALAALANGLDLATWVSGFIGEVVGDLAWTLAAALVGLVLLCLALVGPRYRAGWFFWFLVLYSVPLLLVVPMGTVFGIFFLVYCLSRHSEFGAPGPAVSAAS